MHAPVQVALEFLPPVPHSGPRGHSAQGLHTLLPTPRVSRRLSAQGAGASPAGLSAAIFPPRLGVFPAGGVVSTPAVRRPQSRNSEGDSVPTLALGAGVPAWTGRVDRGLRK